VDGRTISERVRSLQREVARIREENQRYLLKHRHTSQEQQLHGGREQRLRQILSELAQLANDKSSDK
jgi:hypothetical protein